MPGAVAYRDVGKGREQERKLCRGKRDSFYSSFSGSRIEMAFSSISLAYNLSV